MRLSIYFLCRKKESREREGKRESHGVIVFFKRMRAESFVETLSEIELKVHCKKSADFDIYIPLYSSHYYALCFLFSRALTHIRDDLV